MAATKTKEIEQTIKAFIEEDDEVSGQAARFALQDHIASLGVEGDGVEEYLDGSPKLGDGLDWCAAAVVDGLTTIEDVKTALQEYETGTSEGSSGPTLHDRLDEQAEQLDEQAARLERIEDKVDQLVQ